MIRKINVHSSPSVILKANSLPLRLARFLLIGGGAPWKLGPVPPILGLRLWALNPAPWLLGMVLPSPGCSLLPGVPWLSEIPPPLKAPWILNPDPPPLKTLWMPGPAPSLLKAPWRLIRGCSLSVPLLRLCVRSISVPPSS